ncbi:MAG TPA: PPOX class F420-dependent oxidoreductase [Dehalococcoidia bacterium]|jgi:PPOX class probable F420-dependent enzyme|nr:PPOX class F420-dependent oxidoreductase [Dehalococcoidia bacterium]
MTPKQDALLAEANIAVIGTVDAKGRPHATPVWYLYDDGVIRISVGENGQKHKNVARNPNVSLVIDRRAMPYYAVMIQGTAEAGPGFSDEDRLRLAVRYLGEDLGKRYVEMTKGESSVTLRIVPRKVMEFDPMAARG